MDHQSNNPDDKADSRPITAKNGYSIWSLLVIMTLLAVLLAIPKPKLADFEPMTRIFLVACHQVALWVLFGRLLWMLLGKRRSVLILELIVVVVVWGPLFGALTEDVLGGNGSHPIVNALLTPFGLYDAYGALYDWIFRTFGYGSI